MKSLFTNASKQKDFVDMSHVQVKLDKHRPLLLLFHSCIRADTHRSGLGAEHPIQ